MGVKGKLILRWTIGMLIPLLLIGSISYVSPGSEDYMADLSKGDYKLHSELNGEALSYEGPVFFEFDEQQTGIKQTRVFKLHFLSSEMSKGYSFGFLIPLSGNGFIIDSDQYSVIRDDRGLTNNVESVFGYADIFKENSSLYFTESGTISIDNVQKGEVKGSMNMFLKDSHGNKLHLRGVFNALPMKNQKSF